MELQTRQIIEISKLPNGKYVLCVISIVPRSIIYYHKQKEPIQSHRWMHEDDWSAFDNCIESLALKAIKNTTNADNSSGIKKTVNLSPLVQLKIESITTGVSQFCQKNTEIKDLKVKNIAIAVKCEIEYGEKKASKKEEKTKIEENAGTAAGTAQIDILKDELLQPAFEKAPKSNTPKKGQKTLTVLKPDDDDDLDQQIQSFHIGQQQQELVGLLTPNNSNLTQEETTALTTKLSGSASKLELNTKNGDISGGHKRKTKRSKSSGAVETKEPQTLPQSPQKVSPTAKAAATVVAAATSERQRRAVTKPKRFHEFVMEPKSRQSQSPKTEISDNEDDASFEESPKSPKRSRKFMPAAVATASKPSTTTTSTQKARSNTPAVAGVNLKPKLERETPKASRAIFQQESERRIEMLSKKESRRNMQELMEELSPVSPPKVKYLSLNDMTMQQVMSTLNEIKPHLDSIFKNVSHRDYMRGHDGVDHFLVIGLIPDKIQREMMKNLGELYERVETPKFASHIINVLLPEWILSLFMKRYKMQRNDAIAHLNAQNIQHLKLTD